LYQWSKVTFIGIVTLIIIGGCSEKPKLVEATATEILDVVSTHAGKDAVIVNFWATWCEPCVEEFPMIVELGNEYENLQIYFVSVDFQDEASAVVSFLKEYQVSGISFLKNQKDMPFINGIQKQWTGAVPFTMVFHQSDGKIVDFWEGKMPKEKFEQAITRAFK